MRTVYQFKPWARLAGDAQKVGEEIERIRSAAGGAVAPRQIVSAAREERSILHGYFTWRNDEAADRYRESQAAHLLRSIVVVQAHGISIDSPVRAFVSVREAKLEADENEGTDDAGSYTSISEAVRVVKYREQMMRDALRDLDAYRMRYQLLGDISKWSDALTTARDWLQQAIEEVEKEEEKVS